MKGIQLIYEASLNIHGYFDFDSVLKVFGELPIVDKEIMRKHFKLQFVYCQMIKINESASRLEYLRLKFVEFLELLSRISICYCQEVKEAGGESPSDIQEKIHFVLEILWKDRKSHKSTSASKADESSSSPLKSPGKLRRTKKEEKFPELQAAVFEDSDEY